MFNKDKNINTTAIVVAVTGIASLAYLFSLYRSRKSKPLYAFGKVRTYDTVHLVNNKEECEIVIEQLKSRCSAYRVLGFDCEWVTVNGSRRQISMLQLASHDGLCALFRLCKLKCIPRSLREILEDITILKVGVAPIDDAQYLMLDYAVHVKSTLDLRYLALLTKHKPDGLAGLSKSLLNVELDKNWRLSCSNWEAANLTEEQINYAANDAQVAVEIFKKLEYRLRPRPSLLSRLRLFRASEDWDTIHDRCDDYADIRFKMPPDVVFKSNSSTGFHNLLSKHQQDSLVAPSNLKKINGSRKYSIATRTKPLYHNCFLEAPDGELLCTCDTKKAEWYVEKGIGVVVCSDPFTVRLKFEPAGRSVGDVGKFYQTVKENRCVVCGKNESYIRKNVVPREYRKLFPGVMKDHSSHDVLLLCINCHQLSNLADQHLRLKLAVMCDAPIIDPFDPKFVEDADLKKVRSAARALLNKEAGKYRLPDERVQELESVLLRHFVNEVEVTQDLLKKASAVTIVFENANYESHGQKVVEYFVKSSGGLLALELMWRTHFLESMAPQFLPPLWSVDHTKDRLAIRVEEGRIDPKDALVAGIAANNENENQFEQLTPTV